jgi:hypothetical protein
LSDDSANDRFCRSIGIPCQTLSVRFAREKQIKPMTLLLSESETQDLLSMDECIAALGEAYRDLASGEAQNVPRGRIRFAAKDKGEAAYLFNRIPGGSRRMGVCVVRLDSESRYVDKLSERAQRLLFVAVGQKVALASPPKMVWFIRPAIPNRSARWFCT